MKRSKEYCFIVLRIIFVVSSIQFISVAFHSWDGYSYYMHFTEFLPQLSLSYILWTGVGLIIAIALWFIIVSVLKLLPESQGDKRELVITWFLLMTIIIFIKRTTFRKFSLSMLVGLNRSLIILIVVLLITLIIWLGRNHIRRILDELNYRITPLVWLFAVIVVFAVPGYFINKNTYPLNEMKSTVIANAGIGRPNIILVTMDALAARDMQLYGYELPTTPYISEWSHDAVIFDNTYASDNWTTPSAMSLITGQRPWTHRIWYQAVYNPKENNNNLLRVMKDYDYDIYSYAHNRYAHPDTLGVSAALSTKYKVYDFWKLRGWWSEQFDIFCLKIHSPIVFELLSVNPVLEYIELLKPPVSSTLRPSEMLYDRFLEDILRSKSNAKSYRPFFAWIHTFPPHDIYLPPKPYMGIFGNGEEFDTDKKQSDSFNFNADYSDYTDNYTPEYPPDKQKQVDILRKRYDEFILYSDQKFKEFMSRLAKIVDMSNTIIILSSDHGESFSQGHLGHNGMHLYESMIKIPLIIKLPQNTKGERISLPVEQIDIAPTILELAGIPVPKWIEGRALVPLLQGKHMESRPVISMHLIENRVIGNHPITKGTISVRNGDFKIVDYLKDRKIFLYDLRTDPDGIKDISGERPDIVEDNIKLIEDSLRAVNAKISQKTTEAQ